jgi:transcriptional regulator with XRE-family HTH domain
MPRRKEAPLSEVVTGLVRTLTPSLEDLAERSGIGYSTLRDWQRHPRTPRGANIERLEKAAQAQRDEIDALLRALRRAR